MTIVKIQIKPRNRLTKNSRNAIKFRGGSRNRTSVVRSLKFDKPWTVYRKRGVRQKAKPTTNIINRKSTSSRRLMLITPLHNEDKIKPSYSLALNRKGVRLRSRTNARQTAISRRKANDIA